MMCVIPAKGISERLPGKNLRLLCGRPLVEWAYIVARASKCFEQIVVSSEAPEVQLFANSIGAQVHCRDEALADSVTSVEEVCRDVLETYPAGEFCVLLPTSPLRTADNVKDCYNLFTEYEPGYRPYDSVMSVKAYDHSPHYAQKISDKNRLSTTSSHINTKRQDLEPLYYHDGSIIMCDTRAFQRAENFYELKRQAYIIEGTVDIDTEDDLRYAEYLMGQL